MDKLRSGILKLRNKRAERMYMSFMSGLLIYPYFRFADMLIDKLEVNILSFAAMLTNFFLIVFYLKNLRKYYLTEKYEILVLFIGYFCSFILYKQFL